MFKPKQVFFEKGVKEYELGKKLYEEFIRNPNVEVYDEVAMNQVKGQPLKELRHRIHCA